MKKLYPIILVLTLMVLGSGCATYYQRNYDFNVAFERGNLELAKNVLAKYKKGAKHKRNKLLYFMNLGTVNTLLGNYAEGNKNFEQAYFLIEDYQKNYFREGLAMISNPMTLPYKAEQHESLLIHFYKAINFLNQAEIEKALVEVRRMDIKQNYLSDKYKADKEKYKGDAFIYLVMGLVYDAAYDYNNAFIAYRNALNFYQSDYEGMFGVAPPKQLIKDLIKVAYKAGFAKEAEAYEKKYNIGKPDLAQKPEVVFLWLNGLGPVKAEWSLNFTVNKNGGGTVTFADPDAGVNFTFGMNAADLSNLGNLSVMRVAFPKYTERKPVFTSGRISSNGYEYNLEMVEPVSLVARKVLNQRMLEELGKTLLRTAIKRASEEAMRNTKDGEGAAVAISLINALTEKADTRNWQTLPHSVLYTRVPLVPNQEQKIVFNVSSNNKNKTQEFKYYPSNSSVQFQIYQTLESYPPSSY